MSVKDSLDLLIEQYFKASQSPETLNLGVLVEMIEETIGDSYPDIAAASDPAGFDQNINPEMIATQVPRGYENDRATIEQIVAQVMGAPDPAMVDSVMMHFDDHQGLATRGSPSASNVSEGRLPPEQWKEIYRQLLMLGVDTDMVAAIKLLADSGIEQEDLRAMLNQQSMQDARSMQQMNEKKKGGGRFSYKIDIPALVPNEAWGDPKSQSREGIERIFASITRQPDIKSRILHINSFIDPGEAVNKARGGRFNAVLNMMQIIESLQACLNDYSESAAGFVFEGFMAAVTGGKQIAGRVGGTLPIEDFVTGDNEPVSLKLLSPDTGIHGSFTNLIDYLFIRGGSGVPQIKYLIARKNSEDDNISELAIWDFIIDRNNFINIMGESNNEASLLGKMGPTMAGHIRGWQDSPEWKLQMFQILQQTPGYTRGRGMFYKNLDTEGNFDEKAALPPDPQMKRDKFDKAARVQGVGLDAAEQAESDAATGKGSFEAWLANHPEITDEKTVKGLKRAYDKAYAVATKEREAEPVSESFFGEFHEREKRLMAEDRLLAESGKDGGSQWTITRAEMTNMRKLATVQFYGILNLSAENIDKCANIYIEKMEGDVMTLLETTKGFSENIGKYFSSKRRDHASGYAKEAIHDGNTIVDTLKKTESSE
jgi:hypothetical protein